MGLTSSFSEKRMRQGVRNVVSYDLYLCAYSGRHRLVTLRLRAVHRVAVDSDIFKMAAPAEQQGVNIWDDMIQELIQEDTGEGILSVQLLQLSPVLYGTKAHMFLQARRRRMQAKRLLQRLVHDGVESPTRT